MEKKYLAIDFGGTEIKYALMSKAGKILEKGKNKTPERDKTLDDLMTVLDGIIPKYLEQINGIALSLPGILDSNTGYSYSSGVLIYLTGHNLPELLKEKYNLPVTVENDGKAAALAELWLGSLTDIDNAAVVLLGTGVGGGIIIDKELYRGNKFAAGEASFMLTNPKELEFWGGTGGSRYLLKLASDKLGIPAEKLDGYTFFEKANAGDEEMLAVLAKYCDGLAQQLYNLQVLLDLDVIAVGGGISRQPLLHEELQKAVDRFHAKSPFLQIMPGSAIPKPKLTSCKFFNGSNLIGALYHHLKLTNQLY